MKRMEKLYTDKATQEQQLDGDDVKQRIYVHAEMHMLASIINNKTKNRVFIAVSKRCCYLCELYIDFARKNGYNVIVSGNHKKIYSGWKLPHVKDDNFKIDSLRYIIVSLNRIIKQKLEHYTRSLSAGPDSGGNSPNPSDSGGEYLDVSFERASKKVKRANPLFDE
jgi:hypothetical protein